MKPLDPNAISAEEIRVGLCVHCRESRQLVNPRGNSFYRCQRGQNDPRFRDYPGLPVLHCPGFIEREDQKSSETSN